MKNELKIDSELEPYFDIIVKGLKSNPREIIRFLNSLNLMRTLGESLNGIKYEEELLIKWSVLNFSSVDFIEEVKRSPHFLIKVQEISGIKVRNERDKYIQSLEDKKLKERCSYFSGNDRITSVLYHGRKKFTLENIDTYLFLSNIAPKEVQVEEVLFSDKSKTGFVTHLDSTYQEDADLFEADFRDAYLVKANFNRARLMKANLQGANLKEANLQGANLTVADLTEANLQEANLQEANLTGTKMQRANLQGANLTKAKLDRADLTEANLKGANFRDAEIRLAVLYNTLYDSDTLQSILNSNGWNLAICDGDLEKILKSLYKK